MINLFCRKEKEEGRVKKGRMEMEKKTLEKEKGKERHRVSSTNQMMDA